MPTTKSQYGFTGHVSMNISILRTVVILNTHRIELLLISIVWIENKYGHNNAYILVLRPSLQIFNLIRRVLKTLTNIQDRAFAGIASGINV